MQGDFGGPLVKVAARRLQRPGDGRMHPYPPSAKLRILRDFLRQRVPEGIFYARPDRRLEQELGRLQGGERLIERDIGVRVRFRLG